MKKAEQGKKKVFNYTANDIINVCKREKKETAKRLNCLTQLIFDCSTQKAAINVQMLAITCKKTAKSPEWMEKRVEKMKDEAKTSIQFDKTIHEMF